MTNDKDIQLFYKKQKRNKSNEKKNHKKKTHCTPGCSVPSLAVVLLVWNIISWNKITMKSILPELLFCKSYKLFWHTSASPSVYALVKIIVFPQTHHHGQWLGDHCS